MARDAVDGFATLDDAADAGEEADYEPLDSGASSAGLPEAPETSGEREPAADDGSDRGAVRRPDPTRRRRQSHDRCLRT